MKTKNVNQEIHATLKHHGFKRKNASNLWNRKSGGFVDIIDIQVSQFGPTFTLNVAVSDLEVFEIFNGNSLNGFISEPEGIIRQRIGYLVGDSEKWWEVDNPYAPMEVVRDIETFALPFFENFRTRQSIADWLEANGAEKDAYPAPSLNLAILEHLMGDRLRAQEILQAKYTSMRSNAWRKRIEDLAARLDCKLTS